MSAAIVMVLLLSACSSRKQEKKEEAKMEMADSKPVEQTPAQIKIFENVDPLVKAQIKGFLSDYFSINQSLIEDNQDGAKRAAKKLSETVANFDMSKTDGRANGLLSLATGKAKQRP